MKQRERKIRYIFHEVVFYSVTTDN